jgi:DDE superfamily endonuclease
VVWVWDNLNIHLAPELADFADHNKEWLRIYQMPSYAPELNPAEHLVAAQAGHRQLRRRRPGRPGPHRQAQAEEDPVPAPPDQRLPRRDRPDPRTLMIT